MSDRITARRLTDAFEAFRKAYAAAGLHTTIHHPAEGADRNDGGAWVEYTSGALDLVLTLPDQFRNGSISVEPWHNPLHPQRWDGASGSSSPATPGMLGATMREAYDRLTGMTGTLYAIAGAERDGTLRRDSEALRYLVTATDGAEYVDQRDREAATDPRIGDSRALDAIAFLLSGSEWSADTAPDVADLVRLTGRTIADTDTEGGA